MHGDFPNKLTRKIHAEQCLALYSRWRTQQTHACFQLGLSAVQTSDPMSKTQGILLLCNVSYRDNCIGIYRIMEKCIVAGLIVIAVTVAEAVIKHRGDHCCCYCSSLNSPKRCYLFKPCLIHTKYDCTEQLASINSYL